MSSRAKRTPQLSSTVADSITSAPKRSRNDGFPGIKRFHTELSGEAFDAFRRDEKFVDITLLSNDGQTRMKAHRLVLASKMTIIRLAMENSTEIETEMDANTLTDIVNYCYGIPLEIYDFERMFRLVKAAKYCGITRLEEECERFLLKSILSTSNVGTALRLFNANGLEALATECSEILAANFERCVHAPSYNELTAQDIAKLFSSELLWVPDEAFVFTAFLKWLLHANHMDIGQMMATEIPTGVDDDASVARILDHIRFPLMDQTFFMDFVESYCLRFKREDLKTEYYKYHFLMRTRPSEVAHIENTRMKLRSSSPKLFAFGSIEHDMAHNFSMEMLRSTHLNENWIERGEFAALKKIRRYSLSIVNCDHGRIVATGGYEEAQTIKQAILIDLRFGRVDNLPPMNTARQCHASAYFNGCVYVAGGETNENDILNSVERYDFKTGQWQTLPPLNEKRRQLAMVATRNGVFAIGGRNVAGPMSSVEYFNLELNCWQVFPPMKNSRAAAGVILFKNHIYAMGGLSTSDTDTATVERFDLNRNEWTEVAPMNEPRDYVSCCVYNNRIIAAGGFDLNTKTMKIVEMYDDGENRWNRLATMNKPRAGATMFVSSSCFAFDA